MSLDTDIVFHPVDGAVVDLPSLQAIAAGHDRALAVSLRILGCAAVVLSGLELDGELAPSGPPGPRRPEARSPTARVSPGPALVRSESGQPIRAISGI